MIEVSYPPGAQDMVHRHDAHAFVYVLEGTIVMQLKGQPAVTLKAGQTFYEGPADVRSRGAQCQPHGAGQVRRGAAEGQGGSHPHAGARPMMLGTVRPRARRGTVRDKAGVSCSRSREGGSIWTRAPPATPGLLEIGRVKALGKPGRRSQPAGHLGSEEHRAENGR